jgi:hypothetical protein
MKKIATICGLIMITAVNAQQKKENTKSIDFAATFGSKQTTFATSFLYDMKVGKKKKFTIGFGGRFTTVNGNNIQYTTAAPAKLIRENTIPFLILFSNQKLQNIDTLTVGSSGTMAINTFVNFGYDISKKLSIGFNIDVIGFTFGKKSSAILVTNGVPVNEPVAKPSTFNLLLTGENDFGTLNSEFYVKYRFNNKWAAKAILQHLFTEYSTTTIKQTAPDGTKVDRFRNIADNVGIGVSYTF